MHGAVARPDFTTEIGMMGYGERLWIDAADERGFAIAFPLGKVGCEWWTSAGVGNVRAVLRDIQRRVDVDSDRIVGTGFSDGASGCFHLAMAAPDPFAGFVPMNGHPAVAAMASGLQLYPRNLARTPLVVCMTEDDSLYPARTVFPHLLPGYEAGGGFLLISYPTGGHQPAYFEDQREVLLDFVMEARRDAWPPSVEWTAARAEEGRYRWLRLTGIGARDGDVDAPTFAQAMRWPRRIQLGVVMDPSKPDALVVGEATEGALGARLGVRAADELLRINGKKVGSTMAVRSRLARVSHGDPIELLVKRGDDEITLRGQVPEFVPTPIYRREQPAGWIKASVTRNRLTLTSSGVTEVTAELSSAWIGPGDWAVIWNGTPVTPTLRTLTSRELLERFAVDADPESIPAAVLVAR